MIAKIKAEPVMTFVILVSIILAVLIQAGVITIEDINDFIATVAAVIPLVLGGLALRSLVTPVKG